MMECQSTDSGGSEDVSESMSSESLSPDSGNSSALTCGRQQTCLEQVPAVLPCCQTEQISVTGCQLDLQTVNEAQMIVSFCDSKQQTPELCIGAYQELEQMVDGKILSGDLSVQVCTGAILGRGTDMSDEKLQISSLHSHPCENGNSNISHSVNNYNIVGVSDNLAQAVTLISGGIHSETNNLLNSNSQEKWSNNELEQNIVDSSHEPLSECHVHSKQLQQQNVDDDVEQLLQEIDSLEQSSEWRVSHQSQMDHQMVDRHFVQKLENEERDRLTDRCSSDELSLHQDNQNSQPDGSNSGSQLSDAGSSTTDISSQCAASDGIAILTAEQMMPEQLPSAYNVLVNRYLLLRQHRSEQFALQRQLEEDHHSTCARLASVVMERDRCLRKLEEFEDLSAADLEEVKQLEMTVDEQTQQIQMLKERLSSQDSAFKQTLASTQMQLKAQIEQMRKKFEESEKDKQSMVMKYAQAEQKNIELQDKMNKMDDWRKDWQRQRDNLTGRINATAVEKQKLTQLLEGRANELALSKREVERQKELVTSQETRAKWHQNRLTVELEAHKETKIKLEEVQQKLKESKEECDKIKLESQSVIKTYQMSQVMDSITKELQLKETEEELLNQRMEKTEQKEVLQMVKQELDSLKMKEKDLVEELNTYKDKVTCFEAERILQEETLAKFKETLQSQKKLQREMTEKVSELESFEPEINKLRQELAEAKKQIEELNQANNDLMSDMDSYVNQESEHLNFSQKLSNETVRLQSENLSLGDEVASLTSERESLKASMFCVSSKCQALEVELEKNVQIKQQQSEELEKQLKEQTLLAEQLAKKLEDREDELRTLQRRHISSSKDLRRQLSQLQKRLEQYESKTAISSSSTLSRTSSSGSLDSGSTSVNRKDTRSPPEANYSNISSIADIDKDVLIDKIIRLQKSQARKTEKIEFMQDHVNQLLEEVKKKSRIIQNYIMREESYSLAPSEVISQPKPLTTKKGGIVTSMFVSSETGRDMYEDLVEHNSRLQTVLEDKVIHNLTLKHTVETLGQEISHLSNENQKLTLDLQQLRNK